MCFAVLYCLDSCMRVLCRPEGCLEPSRAICDGIALPVWKGTPRQHARLMPGCACCVLHVRTRMSARCVLCDLVCMNVCGAVCQR